MNYRVSQGVVLSCFIIVGLTLLFPLAILGLFFVYIPSSSALFYEMSNQRLNITYFESLIKTSSDITVKYQGHDYVDLPDGFAIFYDDIHKNSQEHESMPDFIVDVAVIIKDGRYSFAAYYSFNEEYFKLYYVDNSIGDTMRLHWVNSQSAFFTLDNSRLLAIDDYL